jgi:glycerol-3-phosphate cytidylyltransferase-like family protein
MGGLFSRTQNEQQKNSFSSAPSSPHGPSSSAPSESSHATFVQHQQYAASLRQKFLEEERRRKSVEEARLRCIVPVSSRPLNRAVLQQPLAVNWVPMISNCTFIRTDIEQHTAEYNAVKKLFKSTTKRQFHVIRIERIQNPYLLGCFLLKKNEMECMPGSYVTERRLFHGTKQCNVKSICENNFDWRLHGDSKGNRFGKGVSFSPISFYASHYSDKKAAVKVMFLVRVLVSNITEGHEDMTIPPLISYTYNQNNTQRYDTSQKENGHVIVKFFDSEYYPEYLIYYAVTPVGEKRRKKQTNSVAFSPQANYTDYYIYDDY